MKGKVTMLRTVNFIITNRLITVIAEDEETARKLAEIQAKEMDKQN